MTDAHLFLAHKRPSNDWSFDLYTSLTFVKCLIAVCKSHIVHRRNPILILSPFF